MEVVWIAIAFVSGLVASLVRLPPLVGYLAAGMALSFWGVTDSALLTRIGDLGVVLLLFMVGLDLRLGNLLRSEVLGVGGVHFALITLALAGVAVAFGLGVVGAVVVGSALSVSSIILAAKTLEEQGDLGAYHGRVAIGILLLQTVVAAAVLTAMKGSLPSPWAVALLGLPLLRVPLRWLAEWIDRQELMLLLGLLLAVGGAYVFEVAGLTAELGALVAGGLLANTESSDVVAERLWDLKEAFLAAFFLKVGLSGFPTGPELVVAIALVLFLAVKAVVFFGLFTASRLSARTAFITAVPLMSYSGFTLVVASAAVDGGILQEGLLAALALATAISYVANAVAGKSMRRLWRVLKPSLQRFERSGRFRDHQPHTLGRSRYLVVGLGRAGVAAYDYLAAAKLCPAGMDINPARVGPADTKRRVIFGDARDRSMWAELDVDSLEGIIITIPGSGAKIDAVEAIREAGYEGTITVLTKSAREGKAVLQAGATSVCLSIEQAGAALAAQAVKQKPESAPRAITLSVEAEDPSATRQSGGR